MKNNSIQLLFYFDFYLELKENNIDSYYKGVHRNVNCINMTNVHAL